MPDSPLSEADPQSLDDLYSADPLSLTDSDVERIVSDLREKREQWEKQEAETGPKKSRTKKSYKEAPEKGQLTLDNLNIIMPGKVE